VQIVAMLVPALLLTGRTLGLIIAADNPPGVDLDMIQDVELRAVVESRVPVKGSWEQECGFGFGRRQLVNESPEFCLRQLAPLVQVGDLSIQREVIRAIEVVAETGSLMHTERSAQPVPKLARFQGIMLRKDFDSIHLGGSFFVPLAFDGHLQLLSDMGDEQAALQGKARLCQEDPKVPTAAALLDSDIDAFLGKLVLQSTQVV
jgi:hypothetical protein